MVLSVRHFMACIALALVGLAAPPMVAAQDAAKSAPAAAAAPAARTEAQPAVPPAAPPAGLQPTITQQTVENPYGLKAIWEEGDWVSKGTLFVLLFMSMGTWYLIFIKVWEQYQLMREGNVVHSTFWKAPSLKEGAGKLKTSSAYRFIAETGLEANERHEGTLTDNIDLNSWVTMSVQRAVDAVHLRLQNGLAFLATVGSTAPFVGLFGTVWGIYHALVRIGISGQASIDKVAGPVGEALIMTALGLAVAVPAVMGYNWLVRRNKIVMESVRSFGGDVHGVLLGRPTEMRAAPARAAAAAR